MAEGVVRGRREVAVSARILVVEDDPGVGEMIADDYDRIQEHIGGSDIQKIVHNIGTEGGS